MSDARNRRARTFLAAALVGALIVTAPSTASALWSASATAPSIPAQGGALAQPAVSCQTLTTGGSHAHLTWPAVAGATGYTIAYRTATSAPTGATSIAAGANPSYDVRGNLLSNLVALLGTLLAGGSVYVTVTATNGTWTSPVSTGTPVALSSVLGGLLGGIRCS